MNIIDPKNEKFWIMYDEICSTYIWTSVRHLKYTIEYYKKIAIQKKSNINDISFIIIENGVPQFALIGFYLQIKKKPSIDLPFYSIQSKKISKNLRKKILSLIEDIIINNDYNFKLWEFLNGNHISFLTEYLLSRGATIQNDFTSIIDLKDELSVIKSNMRKSYKGLINQGEKKYNFKIFNSKNVKWEKINEIYKFREKNVSGSLFNKQILNTIYNMVKYNQAFFITIEDECILSYGLFFKNKNSCWYAQSVSDFSKNNTYYMHSIMWEAIKFSKKEGCQIFETGRQVYINHPKEEKPDIKNLNISDFKSGFGSTKNIILECKIDNKNFNF